MSQSTRLIVNADDFGLHPSINEAVIDGHRNGVITSASLMAGQNAAAFDNAVILAKANPTLKIGLHFTLVGAPSYPSSYGSFLAMRLLGAFPLSRIASLLNKQLTRVERSGITITHIDSHQHLHALPGIMRVVCKIAKERGIERVRLPLEMQSTGAPLTRKAASRALGKLAKRAQVEIERHGLSCADRFAGMAVSGHLTVAKLIAMIDQAADEPGMTEILCHPGTDNTALEAQLHWGYDWEGELAAVKSENVKRKIRELFG